ncbi:MAG TPA: Na-translocating system protein MpsC family protein [Solirubrobacterales bacterium]|nr:Na-translocating system protein MpsC family protein [Solirubrobacterales bacterium]
MSEEGSERVGEQLTGGELNAAVTREVVRIHTAAIGRGPKKSYSFHSGDTLVTVLLEVLTRAEQNLVSYDEGDAVLAMRQLSRRAMADEMKAAVARLTGRRVLAFMSDNHLDPDMAIQVFILEPPPA